MYMPALSIVLTSNNEQVNFTGEYPTQTLRLQSVAINFSNSTNQQTILAIDSELFAHGNVHTNLCNGNLLVPIKTYKYTSLVYCDFKISEARIPQSFQVSLYNADCLTPFDFTNVVDVILSFSFDQTSLI